MPEQEVSWESNEVHTIITNDEYLLNRAVNKPNKTALKNFYRENRPAYDGITMSKVNWGWVFDMLHHESHTSEYVYPSCRLLFHTEGDRLTKEGFFYFRRRLRVSSIRTTEDAYGNTYVWKYDGTIIDRKGNNWQVCLKRTDSVASPSIRYTVQIWPIRAIYPENKPDER